MNRRTLLKGIILGSLASVLGCETNTARKSAALPITETKLEIVLEGPFAVVLAQDKPDQVTVLTPMDPQKRHFLYINHKPQGQPKTHVMKFVADAGALKQNSTWPDISDPCLKRFIWKSEQDQAARDDLFRISLPPPDKILCGGHPVPVEFENRTAAEMSSGYILQYTVTDPSKKVLIIDESTQREFYPDRTSTDTITFDIEAGLPAPYTDPHRAHAIAFFNGSLLPRFPTIKDDKDKRLRSIGITAQGTEVDCALGPITVQVPAKR